MNGVVHLAINFPQWEQNWNWQMWRLWRVVAMRCHFYRDSIESIKVGNQKIENNTKKYLVSGELKYRTDVSQHAKHSSGGDNFTSHDLILTSEKAIMLITKTTSTTVSTNFPYHLKSGCYSQMCVTVFLFNQDKRCSKKTINNCSHPGQVYLAIFEPHSWGSIHDQIIASAAIHLFFQSTIINL